VPARPGKSLAKILGYYYHWQLKNIAVFEFEMKGG